MVVIRLPLQDRTHFLCVTCLFMLPWVSRVQLYLTSVVSSIVQHVLSGRCWPCISPFGPLALGVEPRYLGRYIGWVCVHVICDCVHCAHQRLTVIR